LPFPEIAMLPYDRSLRPLQALVLWLVTLAISLVASGPLLGQAPPDSSWAANAELDHPNRLTVPGLGAAQGVSLYRGKVYLYGDVVDARPRVGVIREYSSDYQPTGRVIWLQRGDQPLLRHPTGLTWHPRWGTFIGDTVRQRGVIYRIDWERALADGNLDHAVRDVIDDDVAVNGCRPEFVTLGGRDLLATADYGAVRPEVRLYDPEKLLAAHRSSAPGAVVARFLCGPFNQNLHWDADQGQIVLVQNVVAGRGWRLDTLDLARAVADGRAWSPGVTVLSLTFPPHDELEGYRPLGGQRGLFITSGRRDNVVVADMRALPAARTQPLPAQARPGR
jgi:hypothetical protein